MRLVSGPCSETQATGEHASSSTKGDGWRMKAAGRYPGPLRPVPSFARHGGADREAIAGWRSSVEGTRNGLGGVAGEVGRAVPSSDPSGPFPSPALVRW